MFVCFVALLRFSRRQCENPLFFGLSAAFVVRGVTVLSVPFPGDLALFSVYAGGACGPPQVSIFALFFSQDCICCGFAGMLSRGWHRLFVIAVFASGFLSGVGAGDGSSTLHGTPPLWSPISLVGLALGSHLSVCPGGSSVTRGRYCELCVFSA